MRGARNLFHRSSEVRRISEWQTTCVGMTVRGTRAAAQCHELALLAAAADDCCTSDAAAISASAMAASLGTSSADEGWIIAQPVND